MSTLANEPGRFVIIGFGEFVCPDKGDAAIAREGATGLSRIFFRTIRTMPGAMTCVMVMVMGPLIDGTCVNNQ